VKPERLFEELCGIAEQLGIQVIVDKGSFRGGSCTVYSDRKIVLNKLLPAEGKVSKLSEELRQLPLEDILADVYLKPALRQALHLDIPSVRNNKTAPRSQPEHVHSEPPTIPPEPRTPLEDTP
jgi:hypothetical protein